MDKNHLNVRLYKANTQLEQQHKRVGKKFN